jgi:hypothetical protein
MSRLPFRLMYLDCGRAGASLLFPLPPAEGEGWGEGGANARPPARPLTLPSPPKGEREHGQPSHKGKGDTQPFVCRISSDQGLTELTTAKARLLYPFAKLDPKPSAGDPIVKAWVDKELASEALSYVLASGREGTVHLEQVLEYNKDPDYLRDRLLYSLTPGGTEAGRGQPTTAPRDHSAARHIGNAVLPAPGSDQLQQVGRPARLASSDPRLRGQAHRAGQERLTLRTREAPTLTPTLSLGEGEGAISIPSPPEGERVRVRGRAGCGRGADVRALPSRYWRTSARFSRRLRSRTAGQSIRK